jgi:hypothetical protein
MEKQEKTDIELKRIQFRPENITPQHTIKRPKAIIFGIFKKDHPRIYEKYKDRLTLLIQESWNKHLKFDKYDAVFFMADRCRHADYWASKGDIEKGKYHTINGGLSSLYVEIDKYLASSEA